MRVKTINTRHGDSRFYGLFTIRTKNKLTERRINCYLKRYFSPNKNYELARRYIGGHYRLFLKEVETDDGLILFLGTIPIERSFALAKKVYVTNVDEDTKTVSILASFTKEDYTKFEEQK